MSETTERDGFEVCAMETGEVVDFIPTTKNGSQRERSMLGLMTNMDLENYFVRDTRDA